MLMNNTSCSVSTSHTSFQPSMLQASDHTSKQSVVELIDVLMKNKKKTEAKMTQVLFLTVTSLDFSPLYETDNLAKKQKI